MARPIRYARGWRVNFRDHTGHRHRVRFPADRHGDAERAAQDYIDRVATPKGADLADHIAEYLRWAEVTGKKRPQTIHIDAGRLSIFCRWAADHGVKSTARITATVIRDFQQAYLTARSGNAARRTWDKYRLILSAFLRWAISRGLVTDNPAALPEFKLNPRLQAPPVPRTLTIQNVATLLPILNDLLPQATAGAFLTMLYAGIRTSEARQLLWSDVDLDHRTITVQHQTKSGRSRTIPIAAQLYPILAALPRAYPHVFGLPPTGEAPSVNAYHHALRRCAARAGLSGISPKTLRHTFAATLAQNGVHIGTIKVLLGHASITTTMIYLHWQPAHLRAAVDSLLFE